MLVLGGSCWRPVVTNCYHRHVLYPLQHLFVSFLRQRLSLLKMIFCSVSTIVCPHRFPQYPQQFGPSYTLPQINKGKFNASFARLDLLRWAVCITYNSTSLNEPSARSVPPTQAELNVCLTPCGLVEKPHSAYFHFPNMKNEADNRHVKMHTQEGTTKLRHL